MFRVGKVIKIYVKKDAPDNIYKPESGNWWGELIAFIMFAITLSMAANMLIKGVTWEEVEPGHWVGTSKACMYLFEKMFIRV